MQSLRSTARTAGILYLLMSILMILGYMYFPARFFAAGDAAETARRIMGNELLYRISILNAAAAQILFVFVVVNLYELFKDVDGRLARLMLALVCVGVSAELVNVAIRMTPFVLLGGADFLAVYTRPQLEAMSLALIRIANNLGQLLLVVWALWLFPFGKLTMRSGWFPRWLGILLLVSGVAYLATFLTSMLFPEQRVLVRQVMTPFYFGELVMVLWLTFVGAREPRPAPAPGS